MKKLLILSLLLISLLAKAQTPSPGPTIYVGGTTSGPVNLQSNHDYSFLTVDCHNASTTAVAGSSVSNIHIHKLLIRNTTGFGMLLNGCSNITVDSCLFDNVGFGVYAQVGSTHIQVLYCQFRNVNGVSTSTLGHAVQFNAVNGGGNKINYNRVENTKNITDNTSHPHDMLNIFESNGLVGDSIQMIGNWVRGGQLTAYPTSGSTGAGFIIGDVTGSYQVARGNIGVNCGCAGIQCIGSGTGMKIEGNIFYSVQNSVSTNAINIQDSNPINVSSNRTNWTNKYGNNVLLSDGETQYDYFGGPTPTGQSTNHWKDATVTPTNVLPPVIITMAEKTTGAAPVFTYSPASYVLTTGITISPITPINTGGVPISYSVNKSLPSGLSFSTSTGVISGTPSVISASSAYAVTATNTTGSYTFNVTFQVVAPSITPPAISYSPSTFTYNYGQSITNIFAINTGGTASLWAINKQLPTGMIFNTSTGEISGSALSATGTQTYTVSASNAGGISTAFLTITVNKVTLTVTANNASRNYGTNNPTFTLGYSGFVGGDNASSLTRQPLITTVANNNSNIGTYVIIPGSGVSNNYNFNYVNATLTVNPVALTITAQNISRAYGSINPALTLNYSGFVNGNTPASLTRLPAVTTAATTSSGIGTYTITPSNAVATNYTISYVTGTFTVAKAPLVITAQSKTKPLNAVNPTLTIGYTGFVNGETTTSLSSQPSISTTAVTNSPAGIYPITVSGASAANYAISYVNGSLTVTAPAGPGPVLHWHHKFHH